jgi:hypothetical protein
VRNDSTRIRLGKTLREALKDVKVIEHVVEGAIIGKLLEKVSDDLLGFHETQDSTTKGFLPAAQRTRH